VAFGELRTCVDLLPEAEFVLVHDGQGYSANIRLSVLSEAGAVFAVKHNGEQLSPEHGYPVRLVVPNLYFWKSVKWVRALEFLEENRRGYWERRGYHNEAASWKEQRYSRQEQAEGAV
jgi:DMSO/TMAO reductase YedYZ molybdopterin-dependent catalytic subunit